MRRLKVLTALALLAGVFTTSDSSAAEGASTGASAEAAAAQHDAARTAALAWLAHVDAGRYGESWKEASSYFRSRVPEAAWQQSASAARAPLGALKTRTFVKATPATSLPGVPDGQYVVLEFRTSFANKAEATETVTPQLDGGVWRVSGYYIR